MIEKGKKLMESIRSKIKNPVDPRKKLDFLLKATALFIGYLYIFVFQNTLHLTVEWISFEKLIEMSIVTIIILPLVHYIIVKPDPLQRSPSKKKAIAFFQNEFPSKFLLERCSRCIENKDSCKNYIEEKSFDHARYWFHDIFHGPIEKSNPAIINDTFKKGYTCKLIFALSKIFLISFIIGLLSLIIHHVYIFYQYENFYIEISALQVIFLLACVSFFILIRMLHKYDSNRPSGCWHAWREINRFHLGWLRDNEDFLVDLICKKNGNDKLFIERT